MIETVTLSSTDVIETLSHSSKGNQPKWNVNNKWYKANQMGYEGLSEVVVSRLLEKTSTKAFVTYYPTRISYNDRIGLGCYSNNFLKDNCELIPIERLHRHYKGVGLSKKLQEFSTAKERIIYTVKFVEEVTNLLNVGEYITGMLEIDALFLNEDRHTNNIAFIRNQDTKEFSFAPYFDHGLSLLSDLDGFWLEGDTDKHILRVSAKPFGSFKNQLKAAHELYGKQIDFSFTTEDIDKVLSGFKGIYQDSILKRVRYILQHQLETI